MEKRSRLWRAWRVAGHVSTAQSAIGWIFAGWQPLLSVVFAILTGGSSLFDGASHVPMPYLLTVVALSFGASMWSFNQLNAWQLRNRVNHSLSFQRILLEQKLYPNAGSFGEAQASFVFKNTCSRVIFYTVRRVTSGFNGMTSMNPKFDSLRGIIRPQEERIFKAPGIPNVSFSVGNMMGFLEFDVAYGSSKNWQFFSFKERHLIQASKLSLDDEYPTVISATEIDMSQDE